MNQPITHVAEAIEEARQYIGTKTVLARPMSRGDYNAYRGWTVPANEDPADAGFLVEYVDGGKANDSRHAGYISWSPADVFARAYKENKPSTFQDRVRTEKAELDDKLAKLRAFIESPTYEALHSDEKSRLIEQEEAMSDYSRALRDRIAAFAD